MTEVTELSVPEVLREAVKVIEDHGWTTGELSCPSGLCALGAIAAARGLLEPKVRPSSTEDDGVNIYDTLENDPAVVAVSNSIYEDYRDKHKGTVSSPNIPNACRIYRWNDTWAEDFQTVIDRFLSVAATEEAKENVA